MDRTERSINKHLLKWRNRLWLGHWLITPGYEEEMDARYEGSAYRTTAYIEADPTYKKAVITFATKTWKAMTPGKRNRTACHEMVHAVHSPIDNFVDQLLGRMGAKEREGWDEWWKNLREQNAEHWCNVMLEAFGELKEQG
jgi:hypothetical protein